MADDAATPSRREPLYPNVYVWFVFVSFLDVMLTYVVLSLGGREVNHVANWVLQTFGIGGMVLFKFALVAVVILICETVGRRKLTTGRRLAEWAVAITCIPVTRSTFMLLMDKFVGFSA